MATDYRAKGYQSGFGALVEGLSSGSDDWAKNKFKRDQELEKRRFDIAKMTTQEQNTQKRHEETLRQRAELEYAQMQLRRELAKNKSQRSDKIDPNDLVAMTTGKFTPTMQESLGNLSPEEQISVIRELARQKGFSQSGEIEEDTGEKKDKFLGIFGGTPVKRKRPVYSASENQFGR